MIPNVPAWVVDAALAIIAAAMKLISAKTDDEREEALMEAAEATKAARDRQKFGV